MTQLKFQRKPFETTINNFVDDLFASFPVFNGSEASQQWRGFVPVNISETDKTYIIEIVAPGFEKADFKISVDEQILTISAEKTSELKEENKKQIRKEHSYRSFKRSFTLDEKTDVAGIDAKYVNGILTLSIPKKEEVKPVVKEINIQ